MPEPEIRGEAEWRPRRLRLVGGPADGETVEVYSQWDRVMAKGALYVPHPSEPDCYVPEAAP